MSNDQCKTRGKSQKEEEVNIGLFTLGVQMIQIKFAHTRFCPPPIFCI